MFQNIIFVSIYHCHKLLDLIHLSIYLSIYLWLYSPLFDLGRFFQFLNLFAPSVGLLGRGISPSHGGYIHTEQHKHRINAHTHPYLKWDSNPRSQYLGGRRRFMPETAVIDYMENYTS
jgi:hypothetical protein